MLFLLNWIELNCFHRLTFELSLLALTLCISSLTILLLSSLYISCLYIPFLSLSSLYLSLSDESTQASSLLLTSMRAMRALIVSEHLKESETHTNNVILFTSNTSEYHTKSNTGDRTVASSLPMHDRSTLGSLLIALHHLLQPQASSSRQQHGTSKPASTSKSASRDTTPGMCKKIHAYMYYNCIHFIHIHSLSLTSYVHTIF